MKAAALCGIASRKGVNYGQNYRDNFDYSEAIANSTSKAERDRLLAERQNKIDAEGLTGRVADNSAVSTWTKGYRPYYVASASSASKAAQENAERVSSLYDAAEKARLERFEAARTRIRQQLDANLSSIDSDYASAVRQAGISARQSALRNEEKLALLGLNMGAKTGAATSGMAESSRIAVDNQYRGDLNSSLRAASPPVPPPRPPRRPVKRAHRAATRAPRKALPCRRRRPCSASITPSAITACPWPVSPVFSTARRRSPTGIMS